MGSVRYCPVESLERSLRIIRVHLPASVDLPVLKPSRTFARSRSAAVGPLQALFVPLFRPPRVEKGPSRAGREVEQRYAGWQSASKVLRKGALHRAIHRRRRPASIDRLQSLVFRGFAQEPCREWCQTYPEYSAVRVREKTRRYQNH